MENESDYFFDRNEVDPNENDGSTQNPIPKENRKLYTTRKDLSLTDLVRMVDDKDLNLSPEFQRRYVWPVKQASKFIESIVMGIPVPLIFLSENDDATLEVIDGQQRLTSIYRFISNKLTLTGLTTIPTLNEKKFEDLPSVIQRKLKNNSSMPIVILTNQTDIDIKYDVFQRINEGAMKLSPQELRNVIYRGKFIDATDKLANNNEIFSNIFRENSKTVLRKANQEIVIRMLAINDLVDVVDNELYLSEKYNGRIDTAINIFLSKYRNDDDKIKHSIEHFNYNMEVIRNIMGDGNIFKMPSNSELTERNSVINKTLAEFMYILVDKFPDDFSSIKENYNYIISSEIYKNKDLFQSGTGSRNSLERRLKVIESINKSIKKRI